MRRTAFALSLLLQTNSAFADARQECGRLRGDAAIAACNWAIRQNPRDSISYYNRGVAYYAKADLDRAIADYNRVTELNPRFANAYLGRGNAYYGKKEYDQAIVNYN